MVAIVHIRDGRAYINCPFDAGFVADIKREIPWKFRSWDSAQKTWTVDEAFWVEAEDILNRYFSEVRVIYPRSERPENKAKATSSGPYETLQLLPTAPNELITAAYRCLAKLKHPDLGGSNAEMKELNNAYDKLRVERKIA